MDARDQLVAYAKWCIARRGAPNFFYAEVRPIPEHHAPETLPITTDCSGWVTILAEWTGLPDPNGANYDGSGYTGTLLNLPHISKAEALHGDLVLFEGNGNHHVVILLEDGTVANPQVGSHGSQGDPEQVDLDTESARHSGATITFVRMPAPVGPPPPPPPPPPTHPTFSDTPHVSTRTVTLSWVKPAGITVMHYAINCSPASFAGTARTTGLVLTRLAIPDGPVTITVSAIVAGGHVGATGTCEVPA